MKLTRPSHFFWVRSDAEAKAFEAVGWIVAPQRRTHHHFWATLMMFPEIWKSVVGYEGVYEVSSLGDVRSVDRLVTKPGAIRGYPRTRKGVTLKPSPSGSNEKYLIVGLTGSSLGEGQQTRYVHHLVAEAFVGPRPDAMEVCHRDGNTANNCSYNLRYGTRLENEADKITHGTILRGERCPASKLTAGQVSEIRRLKGTARQRDLANMFGVSPSNISMIQSGVTWRSEPKMPENKAVRA